MGRYRYRTSVLVGPWRDAPDQAVADAIRTRQARPDETGEGLVWLVPGEIEMVEGAGEASPHQD